VGLAGEISLGLSPTSVVGGRSATPRETRFCEAGSECGQADPARPTGRIRPLRPPGRVVPPPRDPLDRSPAGSYLFVGWRLSFCWGGRGEIAPVSGGPLRPARTPWLFPDLLGDRERDLVLLDAGVKNFVVEERSRLRLEEDAGSLLFDHLVVLGR
jgi:hypothetical protein